MPSSSNMKDIELISNLENTGAVISDVEQWSVEHDGDDDLLRRAANVISDVEQWLEDNEGDYYLLRRAANYIGRDSCTVVWHLVCLRPEVTIIKRILQIAPDTIKLKCGNGDFPLPLHAACHYCASYDVIKLLLDAYPEAAKVQNYRLDLPLHLALTLKAPSDAIKILLEAYPEGPKIQNMDGILPLHFACERSTTDVAFMLLEAYPDGAKIQDAGGLLPLLGACQCKELDPNLVLLLLKAFPNGATIQNEDGILPLHMWCTELNQHVLMGRECPNMVMVLDSLIKAYPEGINVHDKYDWLPADIMLYAPPDLIEEEQDRLNFFQNFFLTMQSTLACQVVA